MLPKKYRLPAKEFEKIKANGNIVPGKFFSLLVFKRIPSQNSRFGFILSRKIEKRSTKRNRARRLLVESIRPFLTQLPTNMDFIFLAKKSIFGKSLKEITFEVEKIFKIVNQTCLMKIKLCLM